MNRLKIGGSAAWTWFPAALTALGIAADSVGITLVGWCGPPTSCGQEAAVGMAAATSVPDIPQLVHQLCGADPAAREVAARQLAELGPRAAEAIHLLIEALDDDAPEVRQAVIDALATIGRPAVGPLAAAIKDEQSIRWNDAVQALGAITDRDAADLLIEALQDRESAVRCAAAEALGRLDDISAVPPLCALLADRNWNIRCRAAESLGRFGDARAIGALGELSGDPEWRVRRAAGTAVASCREAGSVELLRTFACDPEVEVRLAVTAALADWDECGPVALRIEALKDSESEPPRSIAYRRWCCGSRVGRLGQTGPPTAGGPVVRSRCPRSGQRGGRPGCPCPARNARHECRFRADGRHGRS